jgi:hypothetical protein
MERERGKAGQHKPGHSKTVSSESVDDDNRAISLD